MAPPSTEAQGSAATASRPYQHIEKAPAHPPGPF